MIKITSEPSNIIVTWFIQEKRHGLSLSKYGKEDPNETVLLLLMLTNEMNKEDNSGRTIPSSCCLGLREMAKLVGLLIVLLVWLNLEL